MLNNLLYGFWRKYWIDIVLITFIILFFGKIVLNAMEFSEHKYHFEIKCKNKGGVMFIPKGTKGWPVLECRNPAAMIDIDT